jgi:two-component system OmpR family sensor kinase
MRSIFWKIFLIIWASSICLALLATTLLYQETAKKAHKLEWQESFQYELARITSQYEQWGRIDTRDIDTSLFFGVNFLVFDERSGELVYGDPRKLSHKERRALQYRSMTGRSYRVLIPPPDTSILISTLRAANPYQLWQGLIISAVFSLLLSLIILTPLNRLKTHIDLMARGELNTRLDRKLAKRRDEFGMLSRSFNTMAERIQSLVNSKQQLLHDVSHELRAPLSRLQVATELARCEAQVAGIDGAMYDRLDQECMSLNRLIDEILTLSKMEADSTPKSKMDRHDLNALMEKIISDAEFLHPERRIKFSQMGVARKILLAPEVLEKVVKNILENAIKYSEDDTAVDVQLQYSKTDVRIEVKDRGIGMSDQDLQNIFTPFYRAEAYNSKEGYGLGMSIAQKSIEQLGGKIIAANRDGGGIEISVVLPV